MACLHSVPVCSGLKLDEECLVVSLLTCFCLLLQPIAMKLDGQINETLKLDWELRG